MEALDTLERGRAAYERRAWSDAHALLMQSDASSGLAADDLWLLALSATMIGRDVEFHDLLERAHHLHLEAGKPVRAARCAFWLGFRLASQGEMGRAGGWLGRAGRLLQDERDDCVERGYLLVPTVHRQLAEGDFDAACTIAADAAAVAARFDDADLLALALHLQGRALLGLGRIDEGLALLDEAMVSVAADELSPPVTGLVYCSVIGACRRIYALRRANEWTRALAEWCDRQPDLVPFSGQCLVYRAEILLLRGEWEDAIAEARRACTRSAAAAEHRATAAAFYQEGEAHRLMGDFDAAESAFREASRSGFEPQPGLALLRLAQGKTVAAAAAIRRAVAETTDPFQRARLLPACVEISLVAGDTGRARMACGELESVALAYQNSVLDTILAHSCGAVAIAEGDALGALAHLRAAWKGWEQIQAPYDAARVRVLIGLACRALRDDDTAALEFNAARDVFARIGAAPDLARIDDLTAPAQSAPAGRLTPRELQVLLLLATGRTNRAIGAKLFISERTVARHVSNIFGKLGVTSRAAATAYAHRNQLMPPA